jgi:hypothetical protein
LKVHHEKIEQFEDFVHGFIWLCVEILGCTFSQDIPHHVHMCMQLGKVPVFGVFVDLCIFLKEMLDSINSSLGSQIKSIP